MDHLPGLGQWRRNCRRGPGCLCNLDVDSIFVGLTQSIATGCTAELAVSRGVGSHEVRDGPVQATGPEPPGCQAGGSQQKIRIVKELAATAPCVAEDQLCWLRRVGCTSHRGSVRPSFLSIGPKFQRFLYAASGGCVPLRTVRVSNYDFFACTSLPSLDLGQEPGSDLPVFAWFCHGRRLDLRCRRHLNGPRGNWSAPRAAAHASNRTQVVGCPHQHLVHRQRFRPCIRSSNRRFVHSSRRHPGTATLSINPSCGDEIGIKSPILQLPYWGFVAGGRPFPRPAFCSEAHSRSS